jgi:hypothetical protein
MVALPSNRDYTTKDYEAMRERALSLITSVFPTWTDLEKDNFGVILVELFSWILDVFAFYQDQQAREGRMQTLVLRKSMIAIAKLIGYELPGATAATADVVVTITNPSALTGTVVSASGSPVVVATEAVTNPIRGELISPLPFSIPVIDVSKSFSWEHSLTQPTASFSSSGLADQKFLLPFGAFLDDGSEVVETITQGVFTQVDSFYNSGPTDLHYRIQIDQNDRAEVIFGDGTLGEIPVGNIDIDYRTGGGVFGNVEAGDLIKVEGAFIDSVGNPAYLVATNAAGAEGGLPREEVDAAKVNAPASIRVINRTVAREDYEINAKRVNGVGRALMLSSNEDAGIAENRGKLYIVPSTGGTASQALLDAVETMVTVTYPNTVTFQLDVYPASYLTIHVRAVIYLAENTTPSVVKQAVVDALTDFFEPMLASGEENPDIDFGWNYKDEDGEPAGEIAWSDVQNVVRDVTGVRKVDPGADGFTLNDLRTDVSIPNWQFPKLGDVTVINGATDTEI